MLKFAGNIALLDEYTGETNKNNLRRGILSEGFGAALCSAITVREPSAQNSLYRVLLMRPP